MSLYTDYPEFWDDLREINETDPYNSIELLCDAQDNWKADIWEYFKHNKADFINFTGIAFDSNHRPKERRFILFKAQREIIIKRFEEVDKEVKPIKRVWAYEKGRQVGWSNTHLECILHSAIFWGHSSIIGSKNQDAVDKLGDPENSLLPRLRLMLEFIPPWLLHPNFRMRDCVQNIIKIGNGATITGYPTQSPGAAAGFGRSGNVRYAVYDECGFWSSSNLKLAFTAASMTAPVRILFSTPAETSSHFFSELIDGKVAEPITYAPEEKKRLEDLKVKPMAGGLFISFWTNPARTQLDLVGMTREEIDQEVEGKRGGTTSKVINYYSRQSFEDEQGKEYSFEHPFVQQMLSRQGNLLLCLDGGMGSNCQPAVLGWEIPELHRVIWLKEIVNDTDGEELAEVVKRVMAFAHKRLPSKIHRLKAYGDPAILFSGDDEPVKLIIKQKINFLDSLRDRPEDNYKVPDNLKGLFQRREKNRISVLRREIDSRSTDNLPRVIVIRGDVSASVEGSRYTTFNYEFGCPNLYSGLFEGEYKWKKKDTQIIRGELEQVHPVTDIVDAVTYYYLEERPFAVDLSKAISQSSDDFYE